VIVLIGVLASGCAAGGYNANSLHNRLVKAGLRPAQATCVVDSMVHKFGTQQLNARTHPIAAEIRAERTVMAKCGVTVSTTPRR
jgi:hypothetical protein